MKITLSLLIDLARTFPGMMFFKIIPNIDQKTIA